MESITLWLKAAEHLGSTSQKPERLSSSAGALSIAWSSMCPVPEPR
jgi:hypothetical protein